MGMTLIEASKHAAASGDVLRSAIIDFYAGSSSILANLPFININGNSYSYRQRDKLPGVAFRGVNEAYTTENGVVNPQSEALAIAGGTLDYDTFLAETLGMEGRDSEREAQAEALALFWTKNFIKGDTTNDPRGIDGLQVRLVNDQLIDAGATSGGDALSLAKLDSLKRQTFRPTHWIMNETMQDRLTQAARNQNVGGFISFTQDAFGNTQTVYNNLPILTVDLDNEGNEILPFTEANPGGGSAASTSIYCVSFGDQGVSGLQSQSGLMARDLGLTDSGTIYRDLVEWYSTFGVFHGRGAARLRGIKDAAVVV
jgi:hypothetical protein